MYLKNQIQSEADDESDIPMQPSVSFEATQVPPPGLIDNTDLYKSANLQLKTRLMELRDFVILPQSAWHYLLSWHGIVNEKSSKP